MTQDYAAGDLIIEAHKPDNKNKSRVLADYQRLGGRLIEKEKEERKNA